ncbi:MAG TPA: aminodeoxychorismate synthase component I [Bacteroidales bacterium]|nr:aminodeoxychorismate synthase component I [Bacteroidales bacterium]HPZ03114.1 aminodeoxychorismate synthase component I [Bacteroidales bacterium]HQB74736.1 aminodeoxychorismate synthase component I [Bacteroidales bacterium]
MLYQDLSALKSRINYLSGQGCPFFFVINYEQTEGYLVEDPLHQSEVFFKFPTAENKPFTYSPDEVAMKIIPNQFESYRSKFEKLQHYMKSREVWLANLTERTEIKPNISLEQIFALSESLYQVYVPGKFVCFSPERFVKIADGIISTNPMKGTIDATIPNAEEIIQNNPKEIDEHKAAVDLLSEELRAVSDHVYTSRYRYIDFVKTSRKQLLQVSSEIVGELPDDYKERMGDIIFSLLPAGSISGAPKQKVVEVLQDIEQIERGYYSGIAGYFDGSEMDSAVLIRFIEQDLQSNKFYFRSGGGITVNSDCESEYQEVLNKVYLPFRTEKPVFVETIRIENGEIHNLELHQERMQKTAFAYFGTKPELKIDLSAIDPELQQGRIKCRVLYSSDIETVEFHAYQLPQISSLQIVEDNTIEYAHKSTDRDHLKYLFEKRAGADDIIIVKNGKVTDSFFANLVFETLEGELYTPATCLLEGTKRKQLLQQGIIQEREITLEDISSYKKVYLINAMMDIEDQLITNYELRDRKFELNAVVVETGHALSP